MAAPKRIELGAFPIGAVPPSLEHTYFEFDEVTPVNLTGFSAAVCRIQGIPPVAGQGGNCTIATPASGIAVYNWSALDMSAAGDFEAQIWVKVGPLNYPSDLILYSVYDGPGVAP